MYSQNSEELYILRHFEGFKGTLLDIGANDGKTFSNSLALIELGWNAYLVEPCIGAFTKLQKLHANNERVKCFCSGIGTENGMFELHVNEPHIDGDIGLLSTIDPNEKSRWGNLGFKKQMAELNDYATFCKNVGCSKFDFITIDAEGLDYAILSQIDLTEVKMLIVEWNGKDKEKFENYCSGFGMKVHHVNNENIIFVR